jgi:ubiquinone/menaquinone biosynthesis C-methylase UbiE
MSAYDRKWTLQASQLTQLRRIVGLRQETRPMVETSRHDTWEAADRYEAYMGRWSRQIARRFLDWLDAGSGLDWLDIGCGTGALSAAILAQCNPKSLISIDSSEGFVATARVTIQDRRAEFHVGDAQAISLETASRDAVVSALMLNFVPDKLKALMEMKRVARAGATLGFYVGTIPARAWSSCVLSGTRRRPSTPLHWSSPRTSAFPFARRMVWEN